MRHQRGGHLGSRVLHPEGGCLAGKDCLRARTEEEIKAANTDPDYSKKTGVGRWVYPFPQAGNGALDSHGDYITRTSRQNVIDNYLDVEKETIAAYGAQMWTDLFPSSEELGVFKHGAVWQYALPPDVNEKVPAADDYVKAALAQVVLGSPSDWTFAPSSFILSLWKQTRWT